MASPLRHGVALVVACGDLTLRGEVRAVNGAYEPSIDGEVLDGPCAYDVAVARMALFVRARLPAVAPEDWSVVVSSDSSAIAAEFAREGLRSLTPDRNECLQRVLSYCPYATFSDALEAGSQILIHCFQPSEAAG